MRRRKMMILRCPGCRHDMRYQPMSGNLKGKSKRCVYCGKSFAVRDNIVKRE